MTAPSEPVPVPEVVDRIAAGRSVVAVWPSKLWAQWNAGDISSR